MFLYLEEINHSNGPLARHVDLGVEGQFLISLPPVGIDYM